MTIELETTPEDRARWTSEADKLLWETMEGSYSVVCVLLRDIDRLLAEIEALKIEHAADKQIYHDNQWRQLQESLAEIARLKARLKSNV